MNDAISVIRYDEIPLYAEKADRDKCYRIALTPFKAWLYKRKVIAELYYPAGLLWYVKQFTYGLLLLGIIVCARSYQNGCFRALPNGGFQACPPGFVSW